MVSRHSERFSPSARLAAVNLAVQALIERLLLAGTLDRGDLVAMRKFGLELADELKTHGTPEAELGGESVEKEVRVFWDILGVPASADTDAGAMHLGLARNS